ncbi:hypothetical protein OH76DRAFT_292741 [Lentinus brumalis]|uniref:Uncharacterized protein n=1 Tax=Lentinus brumalis TaxID=2498619 RepID=A0A371DG28_9APHY|nr:hypothetical protein OH76DRAFT_292741 [Polyporus brumalis]
MKLSFVRRYNDWRSKHESPACTEDVERGGGVGRNGGGERGGRPARATRRWWMQDRLTRASSRFTSLGHSRSAYVSAPAE